MLNLINPRLKGKFLINDNKEIPIIKLPACCILNNRVINNYDFLYEKNINNEKLIACNNEMGDIELLPIYYSEEYIEYKDKKICIVVRQAYQDMDYFISNYIIENTHYLRPPYKGLTLIAEIKNNEDKALIIENNEKIKTNILNKMLVETSNIMGCSIIDQLTYASPKGRIEIAKELNYENLPTNKRDELLALFKIAWISRFAVSEIYQNIGVGKILAKHAGIVASTKMIPKANYVEVFTSHPKSTAKEILESNKGFLIKSGYKVFNELLDSKPKYDNNENRFIPYKKLYYYKKVVD